MLLMSVFFPDNKGNETGLGACSAQCKKKKTLEVHIQIAMFT